MLGGGTHTREVRIPVIRAQKNLLVTGLAQCYSLTHYLNYSN